MKSLIVGISLSVTAIVSGLSIWGIAKSLSSKNPTNVGEALLSSGFRFLNTDVSSSIDDDFWKQKLTSISNKDVLSESDSGWFAHNVTKAKLICADLATIRPEESTYNSGFKMARDYCSVVL